MTPGKIQDGGAGWRRAGPADAETTLALMRAFYVEERLVFDEAAQGGALSALLADEALGAVFLFCPKGAGGRVLGHLVATWACSLEFGGRFVLLDELCLAPEARGRGEGRRALDFVAEWARGQGAKALRLEVAHENARARATYTKGGFEAHARDLMTRRLD